MTPEQLADALLTAVRTQGFENTPDSLAAGKPIARFPSIDLAVIAFVAGAAPVAANVLFSREHPQGIVATLPENLGSASDIRNAHFVADMTDPQLRSIAWRAETDWANTAWPAYCGSGAHRFVAPYPASLIKLMVLVGVTRGVDAGRCAWETDWHFDGETHSVHWWADRMMVVSCNRATSAMVALLHHMGTIVRTDRETRNELNEVFATYGMSSLRLCNTREDGGWTNAAGAGVGHLQMTAWDTVRLLWLLDEDAPVATWLAATHPPLPPLVSITSRQRIRSILEQQALHEVLSSTALAGMDDWCVGIPAQLAPRWVKDDGSVDTGDQCFPADVRPANLAAQVRFAHKTGTTENYLSDAGIVRGVSPAQRHYMIAMISNLGSRFAPEPTCATDWRVPALGAAIDGYLASQLE